MWGFAAFYCHVDKSLNVPALCLRICPTNDGGREARKHLVTCWISHGHKLNIRIARPMKTAECLLQELQPSADRVTRIELTVGFHPTFIWDLFRLNAQFAGSE
jgi:murein endopeptidase